MAFSIKDVRLNGCQFGAPSPRDFRTVFSDKPIPDRVDLRPDCTPVEDQGQIGSCTANAAVGALELLYKRRDGQAPELSRLFVYYNSRRMRGQVLMDNGAQICDAMAAVLAFGACREEVWPYNPETFAVEPHQDAYSDALKHEAIQYSRVDGVQGSIYALAEGFPVVFGTRIPGRCFDEAAKTGIMPQPTPEELQFNQGGGHAMLIVGYDKIDRMFIVRNSWGENWGDRGYCRIPFDVISACSRPDFFWIVGELAKPSNNFSMIRPGKDTAGAPAELHAGPHSEPTAAKPGGLASTAAKMRDDIRSSLEAEIGASSRKIDSLLSGKTGEKNAPVRSRIGKNNPCTDCMGTGFCHACNGKGGNCRSCGGTGHCSTCGGAGVV